MTRPVEYGFVGRHTEYVSPKPSTPCPANGNDDTPVDVAVMFIERDLHVAMQAAYQFHGVEMGRALVAETILDLENGLRL